MKLKLDIGYKGNILYEDVEIDIPENGVISMVGDNGSGKSTFYKTLLSIIPPANGNIPENIAKNIAIISDYVHLPGEVTVKNILCLLGRKQRTYAEENYPEFHSYVMQYKSQQIKTLSSGQRRIVEIYSVLASGKKIIVLDEASNSLDFSNRELFLSHIRGLASNKIIFFHTSHEINDVVYLGGEIYGLFKKDKIIKKFAGNITNDNLYNFFRYGV